MLYLLDANCFIHASKTYYPLDRVPEYWDWVLAKAQNQVLKLPQEIFDEISDGNDELAAWATENHEYLVLDEGPDLQKVQHIIENGYAPDLTEEEIEKLGRDPLLISYGFDEIDRTIVSKEVSRPGRQRANRKIPDVCDSLGVLRMDDFQLIKTLDFRTSWKAT